MKDWTEELINRLKTDNILVTQYRDLAEKAIQKNTIVIPEIKILSPAGQITTLLFVFAKTHEVFNPLLANETAYTLMSQFLSSGMIDDARTFLKLVETTSFFHCFLTTVTAMEQYDIANNTDIGYKVFNATYKEADMKKIVKSLHSRELMYKGLSWRNNKVVQGIGLTLILWVVGIVIAPITSPYITRWLISLMALIINR